MPLLFTKRLLPHTSLALWQLDESIDELLLALPGHVTLSPDLAQAHPKRQREWLASRLLVYQLLQQFTSQPLVLERDAFGKPYFSEPGLHLSITHAPRMVAVILSAACEVGIDIEPIGPKALKVADKFLTEDEKGYTAGDPLLTSLYWSAKETLYKLYSRKKLIFKENLHVAPTIAPNVLHGRVQIQNFVKLYQIYFNTYQEHVLTYSIDTPTSLYEKR